MLTNFMLSVTTMGNVVCSVSLLEKPVIVDFMCIPFLFVRKRRLRGRRKPKPDYKIDW